MGIDQIIIAPIHQTPIPVGRFVHLSKKCEDVNEFSNQGTRIAFFLLLSLATYNPKRVMAASSCANEFL